MTLHPRTPVPVGGGQCSNRVDQGEEPVEPVDLLAEAGRRAAADTGAADPSKVLASIDSVRVISMLSWRYLDPGRLVAERVGAGDVRSTWYSNPGGNTPQALVNRTCLDVAAGKADVVVVGGAEAWRTRMATRGIGERPDWTVQPDGTEPTFVFGGEFKMDQMVHADEAARGVVAPVQVYPAFESALRAAAGATHEEWAAHLGRLWSRFSDAAEMNPHAWMQTRIGGEEGEGSGRNTRM